MNLLLLLSEFVITVSAQRSSFSIFDYNYPSPSPSPRSRSDFVITSYEQKPTSNYQDQYDYRSNDRNSRGSGNSQGFPNYVRIEAEIRSFDNPQGFLADGRHCDSVNTCDPRITANLDVSKPRSPWPGAFPSSKWALIFQATNTNSPRIGRVVNRDLCGGSANLVNLRVSVVDEDDLSAHDEINRFECLFTINRDDIAPDPRSADWIQPPQGCVPASQIGNMKLSARMRIYQIPSSSCRPAAV